MSKLPIKTPSAHLPIYFLLLLYFIFFFFRKFSYKKVDKWAKTPFFAIFTSKFAIFFCPFMFLKVGKKPKLLTKNPIFCIFFKNFEHQFFNCCKKSGQLTKKWAKKIEGLETSSLQVFDPPNHQNINAKSTITAHPIPIARNSLKNIQTRSTTKGAIHLHITKNPSKLNIDSSMVILL